MSRWPTAHPQLKQVKDKLNMGFFLFPADTHVLISDVRYQNMRQNISSISLFPLLSATCTTSTSISAIGFIITAASVILPMPSVPAYSYVIYEHTSGDI